MTEPTASPHQQQTSSDGSADEAKNAFRPAAAELGVPFHRFQELKKSNLREASLCFAEFKAGIIRRMEWEEATLFPAFDQKLGAVAGSISASLRAGESFGVVYRPDIQLAELESMLERGVR